MKKKPFEHKLEVLAFICNRWKKGEYTQQIDILDNAETIFNQSTLTSILKDLIAMGFITYHSSRGKRYYYSTGLTESIFNEND